MRDLRTRVFIVEQNVPAHEEWDGLDSTALHFLAEGPAGEPLGTLRLLREGATARLGRLAVVMGWRRQGIGAALTAAALAQARELGLEQARLAAQTHALSFYSRFGFRAEGPEFLDAGLPHRWMCLALTRSAAGPAPTLAE